MDSLLTQGQIFILGNPRSGTSLLRLMLTCHSKIMIPPESHFFLWLSDKYCAWKGDSSVLNKFYQDLYASRKFETWDLNPVILQETVEKNKPGTYAQLITCVFLAYATKEGKEDIRYWGDKNKLWKEKVPLIPGFYPDARFIHIVRDGRDVACSFRELATKKFDSAYAPKLPTEIDKMADRWAKNVEFLDGFFAGLPQDQAATIRYEDLISNPGRTLMDMTGFLDLDYEEEIERYYDNKFQQFKEPEEIAQWKEKLKQKPDPSNIGKFKSMLSAREIKEFGEIGEAMLRKYNYL